MGSHWPNKPTFRQANKPSAYISVPRRPHHRSFHSHRSSCLSPAMETGGGSTFLAGDRNIYRLLSMLGLPAFHYDRRADLLVCTTVRLLWTLFVVIMYTLGTIELFYRVQIEWFLNSTRWLSSLSDTVRSMSITYAYQSLIIVTLCYRQRYATYFNFLNDVDRSIWSLFAVRPDYGAVRRSFWWLTGVWLFNHLLVSLPIELYFTASKKMVYANELENLCFTSEYCVTAIGLGMTSIFLSYVAHCLQIRYACMRARLAEAVAGYGQLHEVKAAMLMLDEMETAKELLNDGFGPLLMWKLAIDGLNVVTSVYFTIYKLFNRGVIDKVHAVFTYVLYESSYVVVDVVMVHYFQALGDEVSEMFWS